MASSCDFDDSGIEAVVIDNGSGLIKAGFSGDDAPRSIFHSFLNTEHQVEESARVDNVQSIDRGIFKSADYMQAVWHHVFDKELRTSPEEHPLLLSEPAFNPNSIRESMIQVAFESFSSPAVYIVSQAVLSLLSSGRLTGLVLESGDGLSQAVPVYEGYSIPHASHSVEVGGKDVTEYVSDLLERRGYRFSDTEKWLVCRPLKERFCYVAADVKNEQDEGDYSTKLDRSYELPDGRNIVVRNERFLAPEILFDPSVIGKDTLSIPSMLCSSLSKSDPDILEELHKNVLLTGGNTMFPGFREKTELTMKKIVQPYYKTNIIAPPERKLYVWSGGSILASLSTMNEMWINADEYGEYGSSIVHRKCIH